MRLWLRKELAPLANRPTFAGESRRKCPRNRSGSLERWVFGEPQVVLRRAIVAGSQVVGRGGSGRRGFGCWLARVSAGARQPENDKRVSVVFATCRSRGFAPQGVALRAPRASSFEVSPRTSGKGRASARAATGDGENRAVALWGQPQIRWSTVEAARFRSLAAGLPAASSRVCYRLRKGSRKLVLPRLRHHLARGVTGRPSA